MAISVARQPMRPIRETDDGIFDVKHYGRLSRHEFWSTFLSTAFEPTPAARIQGYYASFAQVPGDALCDDPEFRISVDRNGREHHLNIRQQAGTRISNGDRSAADGREPEFFYRGDKPARVGELVDSADQRVQAILTGIRAVESAARRSLVDRVSVIDYEGLNNAYTCQGEAGIWLYAPLFWNESLEELRTIAEHETLHILSDRLGLPGSSRLRERFAIFQGYGPLSLERFTVVTTGRAPAARPGHRLAGTSHLFDFINELNFLRGMKGGHAADDLDEFCASFLHTLMYVDRLQGLLDRPLKIRAGAAVALSTRQRDRLLEDYRTVLGTMAQEIPGRLSPGVRDLLRKGLETADRIADRVDTGSTAADRAPRPRGTRPPATAS
jgi:hypothetical protein